jgi:hypothetical protein
MTETVPWLRSARDSLRQKLGAWPGQSAACPGCDRRAIHFAKGWVRGRGKAQRALVAIGARFTSPKVGCVAGAKRSVPWLRSAHDSLRQRLGAWPGQSAACPGCDRRAIHFAKGWVHGRGKAQRAPVAIARESGGHAALCPGHTEARESGTEYAPITRAGERADAVLTGPICLSDPPAIEPTRLTLVRCRDEGPSSVGRCNPSR